MSVTSVETPIRILIIDDNLQNREVAEGHLVAAGYQAMQAESGEQGLMMIEQHRPDLVLLDVLMPGLDGFETCRQLRMLPVVGDTPVLFLTVKGSSEDRIRGFEAGGDDYLAKPFHLKELLLRVAAILRRSAWYGQSAAALEFDSNHVDFHTYRARAWDGSEHELTHKEAMILKALAEHEGNIVTREDILDRVWGYEVFPSTRTVDNFIVRLRKRFERNPEQPAHFHTVRGVGYRFTRAPTRDAEKPA